MAETANTAQSSGLELRKQVAMKLGYSEELTVENTHRGKKPFRIIWKPDGSMLNATVAVSDSLEGWRVVPAFESDLGALQAAGIIDALVCKSTHSLEIQAMGHNLPDGGTWSTVEVEHYGYEGDMGPSYIGADGSTNEGQKASEALATALCRCFLSLPAETK